LAKLSVMIPLARTLAALDGVAQRQELIEAGLTGKQLSAGVQLGSIIRVRQGWYALPGTDPDLIRAIRVGGRLACVSAGKRYGWATSENPALHVCLPRNASRLRTPHSSRQRMRDGAVAGVTLHWGARDPDAVLTRLVTSKRETVLQIAHCQSAELAVAAYDSFLHLDPAGSADLDLWLAELPDYILDTFESCSTLCHSFLESIGRIRLAREGIRGAHQVEIGGVGRVDMVIDGWLVIEWDGLKHHDNGPAHDEDCRRDAVAATLGYSTLRFTYWLVMHRWFVVIAAIRAALAGIRAGSSAV
jgi:very-short-patch-repair endonuclease